jgi:SAM-dependent methyltransferase
MLLRENEEGRRIAPHLEPGSTMLDLGAGTGFMARWLRDQAGVHATCADVVDYANRERDLPFVRLNDPLRVPVRDGSYDAVLMMFVLHHMRRWDDQLRLLDEALRVTRRRIVIAEDTPLSRLDRLFNVGWDWILNLRHGVPTPFTFRSVEDWTGIFEARDLSIAHVETYRPLWPTLKTYHHTLFVLDR